MLFYRQRDVLLRYVDEQIVYPKYEEVSDRESRSCIYLFSIDAQRYYFCDETDETLMEAYQFVNIQKMRKGQPKHQACSDRSSAWQNGIGAEDYTADAAPE